MATAGQSSSSGPTLDSLEKALQEVSVSVTDFIKVHTEWVIYHQACLPIVGHAWQDHQKDVSSHIGSIRGLRALKAAVFKELQWVEKHAAEVGRQTVFTSSNAFYLTTSWQQILFSAIHESPITELDAYMPIGSKLESGKSAKVDFVCQGGKKWVRISTIKPISLLSEFRNAESYVVDDESSSEEEIEEDELHAPSLSLEMINAQLSRGEVDGIASQCSIMKLARELKTAADIAENSNCWGRPIVEVALTRLGLDDLTSTLDSKFYNNEEKYRFEARVQAMFKEMESMQLTVTLKDQRQLYDDEDKRQFLPSSIASAESTRTNRVTPLPKLSSPPNAKQAIPTATLNLDLSALVAFVSQISHLPLAKLITSEDIDDCFRKDHWKLEAQLQASCLGGEKSVVEDQTDAEKVSHAQHTRALSDQLRREMSKDSFFHAILNNIPDGHRLKLVCTQEAAEKFNEILSLVGGPTEQKRAGHLLEEHGQEHFWRGSRWEHNREVREQIILPVRPVAFSPPYVTPLPSHIIESEFERLAKASIQEGLRDLLDPVNQATPLSPHNNGTGVQRQTLHTLASLLYGLVNGCTTLTTNIASIKWLLRDITRNEVTEAVIKGHVVPPQQSQKAPYASAVLFYPRSLAEKMMTSNCLAELDCDIKSPPDTPFDWSGDTARDDIRLVTHSQNDSFFKDGLKSSQSDSYEDKGLALETLQRDEERDNVVVYSGSRLHRGFQYTKRWLQGPRPRATLLIRHFRWWPLQPVEEAWLKWTSPLAWKDPNLTQRATCGDVEGQRSLSIAKEGIRGSVAYKDWKLNRLHWIALALTFIGWIFGFTFIVKDLWYEASVVDTDGSQTSPSFFGCTTTFWDADSECGLNGNLCSPFSSPTSIPFRCPASCETTTLGGPRAVGDQLPSFVTLVVGGAPQGNSTSISPEEETGPFIYRGDSFICSAAIHAGVFTSQNGGCSSIWLNGAYSGYKAIERNGVQSTSFNSSFPLSFYFDSNVQGEKCTDRSYRGYILDVILLAWVGFILQPKRIVYYFTLVVVGFWHINFISEPRQYPPSVGDPMGDFLPTLFVAYGLWRVTFRYVWPAFERLPLERNVWIQGFYWLGVLLDVVFAKVPLSRLVASDLTSQPGALTSLIVIIVIVVIIAINQVRVIRKVGRLPKYLTLTIIAGIIIGLLAAIPTTGLRLHHYIIAMCLLLYTGFPTRLSLIYSAFLLGMFLNGVGRWGYDGLIQDVTVIRGSGIVGTGLPSFLSPTNWTGVPNFGGVDDSTGLVHWQDIPSNQTNQWDSFQLLVDDVLRLQSSETSFNISQLSQYFLDTDLDASTSSSISSGMLPASNLSLYPGGSDASNLQTIFAAQPHFLRLAFYNSNTANLGDFTEAATIYYNGTFISPKPGAT